MRKIIKSFFNAEQHRSIRRAINAVKWPFRRREILRRTRDLESRIPYRPNGRVWRSDLPLGLHMAMQEGTIDYTYRDVPMLKYPMDMALYTLLVWKTKPRTIIEIGAKAGGSALWFADLLKTFGIDGHVFALDIAPPTPPFIRDDITFQYGDANNLGESLSRDFIDSLPRPFLIIEDASHHHDASLATLKFFDPFMRAGEYIVVEDGGVSDMGDDHLRGGGPGLAISEFLMETKDRYEIDASYCDRYGHNVTSNTNGYLRCVRSI